MSDPGQMKSVSCRVLFLCTGNYYRSRFAEILFNHQATAQGLNWSAFSRALDISLGGCNIGPISQHTRLACDRRGIALPEPIPFPQAAADAHFAAAHHIIALKEAEHRRYVEKDFARWAERVEYWQVHDLDAGSPEETCDLIEQNVRRLIEKIRRDS